AEFWESREQLALILPFFEHVLNGRLVDHQVRLAVLAIHLDAITVIPLNDPAHFFAVAENDHHGGPRLHLLLIIKILGVGLFRRCRLLAAGSHTTIPPIITMVHAFSAIMPL